MTDIDERPWWERIVGIGPGTAALLGFAIGEAVAVTCAFSPPRDFSVDYLVLLLLTLGPFGTLTGYFLWLAFDPVRELRLRRLTSAIALPTLIALFVAFPRFWQQQFAKSPLSVVLIAGFCCAMLAMPVAGGMGVVHLVEHLAGTSWRRAKRAPSSQTDGLWDRDLD